MLRTKVVCTLGPATSRPEDVLGLAERGMDLARLNMSHGSHDQHLASIASVRRAARRVGRPIGIMADLAGPKIRLGELRQPIPLEVGDEVSIVHESIAQTNDVAVTYEPFAREVPQGSKVLVDDGRIELRRLDGNRERARFEVIHGGLMQSNKGVNIPFADISAPSLTEKDGIDLEFALNQGVECIALSFVRDVEDVRALKRRVRGNALIVSKIEKVQALHRLENILTETDMAMIARGDLGVELPFERVPLA